MAYSSLMGAEKAPTQPRGRGSDLLGPSDNSDSGSDALGTDELHGDSDAAGTGERGTIGGADAPEGRDILPDHVVRLGPSGGDAEGEGEFDEGEFTDLDADTDAAAAEDAMDGDEDGG